MNALNQKKGHRIMSRKDVSTLTGLGVLMYADTLTCSVCGKVFIVMPYDNGAFLAHESMCKINAAVTNVVDNVIEAEVIAHHELSVTDITTEALAILEASGYEELGEMRVCKEVRKQLKARKAEMRKGSVATWHVVSLDVWGNEAEGFYVNDRCEVGTVEFSLDASDEAIRYALTISGFLTKECKLNDLLIEWVDEGTVTIDERATRKPVYTLERVPQ